jgi:hypothetical protein
MRNIKGDHTTFNTNLDQEPRPKLSRDTIWLSGKADDGFDIVLSTDTQAKVEGVLEGCGTGDDNKCYQDVVQALESADLELDSKLERRELAKLLSDTMLRDLAYRLSMMWYIGNMLLLNWKMKADKMDNAAFHLPVAKVQELAISATGPSIIQSAGGSVVVTITPTLVSPSLTG